MKAHEEVMGVGRPERTSYTLDCLAMNGEVSVSAFAEDLDVSLVTIRTTLKEFEDEGYLARTHGGARPTAYRNIHLRQNDRIKEKERIARAVAAMIRDDDRIMIEAGMTCSLVVKCLTGKRGIQVVTNSLPVFQNARPNPHITVTLTGGRFHPETEFPVGPAAEKSITDFNARPVFLGTDGFSVERGLTTQLVEGGHIGALMSKRTEETWLLSDSSKYGRAGFVSFMGVEDVTGIITDDAPLEEPQKELSERTQLRIA